MRLVIVLAFLIISGCQAVEIIDNQHENISGLNDFEIIADSLTVPWGIAFLPNGELLVTERPGRIVRIGADKKIIEVNGIRHIGEGGLLGVAIHPNYSDNRWVYIYFTTNQNGNVENRIERYALQNNSLSDRKEILSGIPGAANHDGGRIAFGPDGKLYATTGDAGNEELSQDTTSLAGKILRLNDDGSIPEDNPFGNAVYTYGHRNAQGLAWDDSGNLWATEHGRSGYDELNLIAKGKNYGWPEIEGEEKSAEMEPPVINSGPTETWAPAGAAYYSGKIYFAGLRGQALYSFNIKEKQLKEYLTGKYGRLRAVAIKGDRIYFSTSNNDGRGMPEEGDDKIISVRIEELEKQ